MFIPFDELPEDARIWVYQADRILALGEKEIIKKELLEFTTSWLAHGHPLQSSFTILEDCFVVLAVNENVNDASGCSIDLSTNVMKHVGTISGIDFFNRTVVSFEINGELRQFKMNELKQKFQDGILDKDSVTFNTLADTSGALRQNWRMAASKNWVKRYIEPAYL